MSELQQIGAPIIPTPGNFLWEPKQSGVTFVFVLAGCLLFGTFIRPSSLYFPVFLGRHARGKPYSRNAVVARRAHVHVAR